VTDEGDRPTEVEEKPTWFDRFADWVARFTSKAWFFALCVALVTLWAPSVLLIRSVDTWQLIINTATTIITFLLVALQANTAKRADTAIQTKLNAVAAYLLDDSERNAEELAEAVGLEDRSGT
jgi:low affinity Fe/Cu permease